MKPTDITAVLRCKVVVCGDAAVGKSALVSMFTSKGTKFPKEYKLTGGVDVAVGQVQVPDTTVMVELYLHDTAGGDVYKDALAAYWNGAYSAVLVYDVTSQESFESCKLWLEELKKARPDKERMLKAVLVGTKSDLPAQRHQVADDVASVWANQNGLEFFSVSSVQPGTGVDAPFEALARAYHQQYEEKVKAYKDACANY